MIATRKTLRCALAIALCILLLFATAAAEISADDIAYWESMMDMLVYDVGSRDYGSVGEGLALYYLESELNAQGYDDTVGYQLTQGSDDFTNLVAVKPAKSDAPGIIIISAHYDTCAGTAGAKDNASGLSAMLTLSRRFAEMEPFEHTELRFIAFAGEELGMIGAGLYGDELTDDEKSRLLGVVNIDLIAVDEGAQHIALSCNTLGGSTENGYREGSEAQPIANAVSRAFESALLSSGYFAPEDRGIAFYAPRHWGEGDHVPFHERGLDAATICFQGNADAATPWPTEMHTPDDTIVPFDTERTGQALDIVYTAICAMAQ